MPLVLALAFANCALLCLIVKWRGFHSFEGLGSALLAFVIAADALVLPFGVADLLLGEVAEEVNARVVPLMVHLLAVLALGAGLLAAPGRRSGVRSIALDQKQRAYARATAWYFVAFGLSMKTVALWAAGYRNPIQYLLTLSSSAGTQADIGGFWDMGVSIALLGGGVLAATESSLRRSMLVLLAAGIVSFSLSSGRADLVGVALTFLVVFGVFNHQAIRALLKRRWTTAAGLAVLAALLLVNAGIKSQLRAREFSSLSELVDTSADIWAIGLDRLTTRFGPTGLFDGYVNVVNRLDDGVVPYFDGEVLRYALTSWVPYVVYPSKPPHPFRGSGDYVYDDLYASQADVSAFMLVGSTYADSGILSTIVYLFFFGLVLGSLRWIATKAGLLGAMWYLHFVLIDGASNFIHGGILNFMPAFVLSIVVMLVPWIVGWLGSPAWRRSRHPAVALGGYRDAPIVDRWIPTGERR